MRAIFISYRRDDSEGEAGRLFDDLVREFGEGTVFIDVAGIEPGRDFRKAIDQSVANCGVLLAIIGKDWVDARDESGQRRLENPSDFVRLETASALKRDIPVIPLLVRGAKMPQAERLPDELKDLAYRNAVELSGPRWSSDVQVLLRALRPLVQATSGRRPRPVKAILASALGICTIGGIVTYSLWQPQTAVPDVTGMSLPNATAKLEGAGLALGFQTYQANAEKGQGTVLSQSPPSSSRVKRGTPVSLVLSQRPRRIPNFAGTWEIFESVIDGVPKTIGTPIPLTITQDKTGMVRIGDNGPDQITAAGTIVNKGFFANKRKVENESQADMVQVGTWSLDGTTLVYESDQRAIRAPAISRHMVSKYRRRSTP